MWRSVKEIKNLIQNKVSARKFLSPLSAETLQILDSSETDDLKQKQVGNLHLSLFYFIFY